MCHAELVFAFVPPFAFVSVLFTTSTSSPPPEVLFKVISIVAFVSPLFTNSDSSVAHPNKSVLPFKPNAIAQTKLDFPVLFAPINTFKSGPGVNETEEYVMKFDKTTFVIDPAE